MYVKSPNRFQKNKSLWLLKATVYSIVPAGRRWQRLCYKNVQETFNLEAATGMPQLFVRYGTNGEPVALLVKYVDDLLVAAKNEALLKVIQGGVSKSVEIGSWEQVSGELDVKSTEVVLTKETVNVTTQSFIKRVEDVSFAPGCWKDISSECKTAEIRKVRALAGKLGYIGVSVPPIASFAASYTQKIVPHMKIAGVKHANGIARDVLKIDNTITYLRLTKEESDHVRLVVFSDAGLPHQGERKIVAQETCVFGVAFRTKARSKFRRLIWLSHK